MQITTLKKRREFLALSASGIYAKAKGLVLQAKISEQQEIRVGYTVTKRVGKAVIRNRVKRRLRALSKDIITNHAKTGYDYVLIGRNDTIDREFNMLKKDLLFALHNLDLYKAKN